MSYSKKVQKAKASRSDHRKARAVAGSVNRTAVKRDAKKFKSLEREHDQDQRFGGSLKSVYFDSDGDGFKDTYGRVYRSGVVGKPGAEIPTFGTINPPVSGPAGLTASKLPDEILAPVSGPSGLSASVNLPNAGPAGLDASVNIPNSGPTGLNAFEGVPDAPASGPTGLDASVNAPSAGPNDLIASVTVPNAGPTGLDAGVAAPASGPSGLTASEVFTAPTSGPTGLDASVNAPIAGPTDLAIGVEAPNSGPTDISASVNSPASGPTGLDATKLTLNITIEPSQNTIVAKTPDIGTIEYASDAGHLFIYDGTDWHRINGA